MKLFKRILPVGMVALMNLSLPAAAQMSAQSILEASAEAMGGMQRIMQVDSLLMSGFSQTLNQDGGGSASPDPRAPKKWAAQNGVERYFNLETGQALQRQRQGFLFPFALAFGHSWAPTSQIQDGVDALNNPLVALRAALDSETGAISIENDNIVVEFGLDSGETVWLGINQLNKLPAFVRWIGPHANLGEVTYTTWFSGYVPFDGIRLPSGFTTDIDWRDNVVTTFHIDGYQINEPLPRFEGGGGGGFGASEEPQVAVTEVADGVWDLRVGRNGGAVVEFEDHLLMFEVYGNEANSLARIDAANQLVPGKQVSAVIMSHHHFDHSGGIRAAVSRGLTIISKRENESILREMTSRPAPNYPDALARNPQPLRFMPVDEHLVLEDSMRRVDVYEVVEHMHMTDAVFAYVPEYEILLQGDMFDIGWDWHWWSGNYQGSVEHWNLSPQTDIPVHGRVTTFDEVLANIQIQLNAAIAFCENNEASGIYMAGCPVNSRTD